MPPETTTQPIDQDALNLTHAILLAEHGGKINYNQPGDGGTSAGGYQWHSSDGSGGMSHFASDAKAAGLDPNDFSPKNQDKVAYAKIKAMKDKGLTPAEIASTWNSGSPNNWQNHRKIDPTTGKVIYDTPAYVSNVQKYYNQIKNQPAPYNPTPFSSPPGTPGAVDLSPDPNAPQVTNLKDTGKDLANKGRKGILNIIGNVGTGIVKGTGQLLEAPAKGIANIISEQGLGLDKQRVEAGNAISDTNVRPKGTSQKVGAFVGRDVLPATAAATTGAAYASSLGVDVPEVLGKIGQLIGKTYRGAKTVGKVAAGTALAAEAIKNRKQVFGLIGKLIDGLSHLGE